MLKEDIITLIKQIDEDVGNISLIIDKYKFNHCAS